MVPRLTYRGTSCPTMLATNPVKRLETVSTASVRGHIWGGLSRVNAFFYKKVSAVSFSASAGVLECSGGKLAEGVASPAVWYSEDMRFNLTHARPALRLGAAAVLCATSSGTAWATAAEPAPPDQDGLVAIVPAIDLPADAASAILLPDQQARPTTQVRIAGNGPFRFLVDTGAQATVIARDVATTLALRSAGTGILVATGSQRTVDLVEVTGLGFANRELNLPASPVLEREHLGADGILGLDTLQGMRVLIDFGARRITVADPHDERASGTYEIIVRARKRLGQMIITDATIDGVRTTVIVDTGASLSIGNRALQRRLRTRFRQEVEGTDVNGVSFVTDLRVVRRIEIDSLTIDAVQIGFADSPAFAALKLADSPALILGMNALQGLDRLALDFAARKIMFDLPRGASNKDARWSRF